MAARPAGLKGFYGVILVAALAGAALLGWMAFRPKEVSIPANVVVQTADTAGFRGYLLGSAQAPVEVTEYADYQCPACQEFETVQFPDVRQQLIDAGRVRWRYRDFPLTSIHRHSLLAAHAAACAADQDKYWEMHRRIYAGQDEWATANNATPILERFAGEVGLDVPKYRSCMSSARFAGRIEASRAEAEALGVGSTPTFLIAGRLYPGVMNSDRLRAVVDSIAPVAPTR